MKSYLEEDDLKDRANDTEQNRVHKGRKQTSQSREVSNGSHFIDNADIDVVRYEPLVGRRRNIERVHGL